MFSTDILLIHNMLDFITRHTSKGHFNGMIMLDLQKACDNVDHKILCDKLQVLGVLSTEWFMSYVSGRQQQVYANNVAYNFDSVERGVHQGSILGPLLFYSSHRGAICVRDRNLSQNFFHTLRQD
jgi:hypothetical protein